jgi:hypothetical protein
MKLCKDVNAVIVSQDYNENYTLIVNIKKSASELFEEKIKLIYNTQLTYLKTL